jgi:hypothetical protein
MVLNKLPVLDGSHGEDYSRKVIMVTGFFNDRWVVVIENPLMY